MPCWSSENATRAYLQALKMGRRGKEPDVDEFISALAAGNNAQLMVMVCSSFAVSTTIVLVAAAHQTGGRVVCILHGLDTVHSSENALGPYANSIEFVVGDAQNLLVNEYKGADFVLIDCNIDVHKGIFRAAKESTKHGGGVIVGYNALHKGSWSEFNTHFLPIGNGLLGTKTTVFQKVADGDGDGDGVVKGRRKSRWIVTVDKCTGEEHVFRITSSHHQRVIRA